MISDNYGLDWAERMRDQQEGPDPFEHDDEVTEL